MSDRVGNIAAALVGFTKGIEDARRSGHKLHIERAARKTAIEILDALGQGHYITAEERAKRIPGPRPNPSRFETRKKKIMGRDNQTVTIDKCRAIRKTPKAIVIVAEGFPGEYMIPDSLVHDDSEVYAAGHTGKLVIPLWKAEELKLA